MSEKIFIGSGKEFDTKYGKMLKVSFSSDDLSKMASHLNDRGYINLVVREKKNKEPGRSTHYLEVDTWQPKQVAATPKKNDIRPALIPKLVQNQEITIESIPF